MKKILGVLLAFVFFLSYAPKAHAIIILPIFIPFLLPVFSVVGTVLGGLVAPVLGGGVIWSKFFGHSMKRTLLIAVGILLLIGVVLTVILKIQDPGRHLFNSRF